MIIPSRAEAAGPAAKSMEVVDLVSAGVHADEVELERWTRKYVAIFRTRFAFDLDYAAEFFRPSTTILEVGSSPPVLTLALQRFGFSVTGADIEPERFAGCLPAGVNISKVNIETERWPFEDATFDGIVFNEIFEHLRINVIFTISELNRVLKPGGRVLLSTPNAHSALGIYRYLVTKETMFLGGSVFNEYAKLSTLGHMGHVREYGVTDVLQFFSAMGFRAEQVIYRGAGTFGKVLPKSLHPFLTFVFTKVDVPRSIPKGVSAEQPASDAPRVKPWMMVYFFVIIGPIVFMSWIADRFLLRWLLRRMGYPVVR